MQSEQLDTPMAQVRASIQLLAESNVLGIFCATKDGSIVDANDEFLRIIGYSREDLQTGKLTWMDITPPEWMEEDRKVTARVTATGKSPAFEKEYIRKDGTRVPVLIGIVKVPGTELDALSFVVDLSERKGAEKERDRLMIERLAMLESVGDGIYGLDSEERCTFINRAAARMLGYEPGECLGRNMHELVHSKYPDGSPYPIESCPKYGAVKTGAGSRVDNDLVWRRDGTSFPVDYSSCPIVMDGRIEGTVVSFKDISERKKAEAALMASQERFHSAFANAAAGMFILDLTFHFLDVNLAFCSTTGYSREELVGQHIQGITHPGDVERNRRLAEQLVRQEIARFVTVKRYIRKDGSLLWARGSASLLCDAAGKPAQIVGITEDITERLRAETDLRLSEQRYRSIAENTHEGICICDSERGTTYCNPRLISMLGYEPDTRTLPCSQIHFEEDAEEDGRRFERRRRGISESYETRLRRQDGSVLWASTSASPLKDDAGNFGGGLCMFTDVTERKKLEEQLRHSQKMEAVGRLAGGVAHDFNNLLTVILGHSSVVERKLPSGDPLNNSITEIRKAGERAAALTQKLLAFSRKQVQRPRVFPLNHLIRDTEAMLRRLIGENIELITTLDPAAGNIQADPGQMEQVLMNLSINARDAMQRGGRLLIETSRQDLQRDDAALRAVQPGPYAVLKVTDTGCGMDQETKSRIFEPFFTTKETGLGTGLGLSTVLGIVNQSGGSISVYSEVNLGTTFNICLPLVQDAATVSEPPRPPAVPACGETVLVVEDDPGIRSLAGAVLREHGYKVMEVASAEEALAAGDVLASANLLLTDVIMRGMNGHELAERLVAEYAALKVLYMSGYTENAITRQGILDPCLNFLAKPFLPDELLDKVGSILAKSKAPRKILAVDDDAQVRSFLAALLESDDYQVLQASNGKQAEELCRETPVDLVITDLVMPEQEGLETIHAIRRNWPQVPVVAISGACEGAYLELAKRLGADAVFRKPFEPETILSEVRRLIER